MNCSPSTFPLVAVATPVYNGERFLADTMACVQSQDYPNLVHVVLDNASTDATSDIIAQFSNGRVPVLASRNATTIPMVANFNAAVRLVPKGATYFRLLCADDLMTPDCIRRKVELAERHPDASVVGCLEYCDGVREEHLPSDQEVFDGRAIVGAYLRQETSVLSGTQFLFRRTLLDIDHPFYDEKLLSHTDADASLRACLEGNLAFIHEGLAIRRQHDSNAWDEHVKLCITTVDRLDLLTRYGTTVLDEDKYRRYFLQYKRHCLRRLFLLRWRDNNKLMFAEHLERLRAMGHSVGWVDFADALAERAKLVVTKRRHMVGIARD